MNTPEVAHRKLKNMLINPPFQLKFLSYFVGLFFITSVSLYSVTFLVFWRLKQKALSVGIPDGHVFYKFLTNQKNDLDSLFIGLAIFNLILLIGMGLIISHRIAGPIHKLKTHLNHYPSVPTEFKLRETDFFQELEPLVNDFHKKSE